MKKNDNISIATMSEYYETVINHGLRFEGSRLYTVEEHQKPNKHPYEVKVDVTEQVLNVFLKILEKRREIAYENSILSQLRNR